MNTQNKGDILAERIEAIFALYAPIDSRIFTALKSALAEYRKPPPILTPEQIAAGWLEWHGGECPVWGESKPTMMFRNGIIPKNDIAESWYWKHDNDCADIIAYLPDPYESLKKAHAEGKTIQIDVNFAIPQFGQDWRDDLFPSFAPPPHFYRVKPNPVMVPLVPEDVTPGSAIRAIGESSWGMVGGVGELGIHAGDEIYSFQQMQKALEISRDGGKTWVRCEKEAK